VKAPAIKMQKRIAMGHNVKPGRPQGVGGMPPPPSTGQEAPGLAGVLAGPKNPMPAGPLPPGPAVGPGAQLKKGGRAKK
jgi:hypothetical protein